MGTAGVPPCQPPALGSVSLPGCLGRRYLSPLGRAEGSSFLKPLVGSPLHLAHCGSPATEGHQELRGTINNQVTGGSCPFLSPVTSETAGRGQTFQVAPLLLHLACPLEGKQPGIGDTQFLVSLSWYPLFFLASSGSSSFPCLSVLIACLQCSQNRRLL